MITVEENITEAAFLTLPITEHGYEAVAINSCKIVNRTKLN